VRFVFFLPIDVGKFVGDFRKWQNSLDKSMCDGGPWLHQYGLRGRPRPPERYLGLGSAADVPLKRALAGEAPDCIAVTEGRCRER
jgi:hypothetical protein